VSIAHLFLFVLKWEIEEGTTPSQFIRQDYRVDRFADSIFESKVFDIKRIQTVVFTSYNRVIDDNSLSSSSLCD
jgi:hypothetical protein